MQKTFSTIILASRSPRRTELLKQIGIDCIVMPADIDESVRAKEKPTHYVLRLAIEKAQTVAKLRKPEYTNMLVLAADTTVALDQEILGKPDNDEHAVEMLKKLSGTKHQVHTAVAICGYNQTLSALNTTQVSMMSLDEATIKAYIASGEHRDKAGSYGIQGMAGAWIESIQGSYSGVMGLPLYDTAQLLTEMKAHLGTRNLN
jgi:septum formation protein